MTKSPLYLFSIIFVALFSSCNSSNDKSNENNVVGQKYQNIISNRRDTKLSDTIKFAQHEISFYLNNAQIPKVCKDLYNKKRPISDSNDVLALMDSVFTTNIETKPFYFLTITQTMKKSDGAYSEPLGVMGKQFIETNTKDFLDYFINEKILTNQNFEEWAHTVAGEIQIIAEKHEKEEVEKTMNIMKKNCTNCSKLEIEKLNDFDAKIKKYCH